MSNNNPSESSPYDHEKLFTIQTSRYIIFAMTKNRKTYLDYNATTPIKEPVKKAMIAALDVHGNPSSVHGFGRIARKHIEDAREKVAKFVNARASNIILTGSATEANNTVLFGLDNHVKSILICASDHPSTLRIREDYISLAIHENGVLKLDALEEALKNNPSPALVCVHAINSETGVIQPIQDIAKIVHMNGGLLHCDAVQAGGRVKIDYVEWGCDFLTISAHKMGGPLGVGALIAADLRPFEPFIKGGSQEKKRRAGTENVAGIVGLGTACEHANLDLETYNTTLNPLQIQLEKYLKDLNIGVIITGEDAPRATNTVNIVVPDIGAETMLMFMDLNGIAVSSGSACSSGSFKPSHVLTAMGIDGDGARSSMRISMGWDTKPEDIDHFIEAFDKMVAINLPHKKQA